MTEFAGQLFFDTETDAAWYYPEPKEAAKQIKDYVAFYKGVEESS
ncbi:MAG: DUF427 domain-containing protein [Desulfobacterales bacterium]|nr:DUF427 domain-containing protein [Desulfobacterales bacterium]MCK5418459.1 DUF427 domain-containing protein [Desulfobacterales bacterium]MCK5485006.1 DUF427 domain-containing protein [Desulfobacterales bacterium]NOQ20668.1 DUF427 domain-containing protein [Desulfobacterales bacterium]